MSHTPGPWKWERDEHGASHLRAMNGTTIVNLEEGYEMGPGEADAKLLEHAPDLLNALSRLVARFDTIRIAGYVGSDYFREAREAIKKAKGG